MTNTLKRLFVDHWPRKLFSLILAIVIYFVLAQTMTTSKTYTNIPVKIVNLPEGKTVEGMQSDGLLNRRITLTLTGHKDLIDELGPGDLEVIIDATGHEGDFIASITKRNLISTNPDFNLSRGVSKVSHKNFIVKMASEVEARVPIIVTQPIGQPPKGYHFLDIWPYQLYITVKGPEDVVNRLKSQGLKLTFNLNDVSREALDEIQTRKTSTHSDVVTFVVPKHWKQVSIPALSNTPLKINDPAASHMRIDFVRYELVPLTHPIPISLYFPPNQTSISPQKVTLSNTGLVEMKGGQRVVAGPLFVKGVSELFVEIVSNMIEIVVPVQPKMDGGTLDWSVQFISPKKLEDNYVRAVLADTNPDHQRSFNPRMRESYLRNRFRSYMQRMQLFDKEYKPLDLKPVLQGNKVVLQREDDEG